MTTLAYESGYRDGLAWDLDGYESVEEVRAARNGWDSATISALGSSVCAEAWGVSAEGDAWEHACHEYNRGAHAGACAPQEERTGLPPYAGPEEVRP